MTLTGRLTAFFLAGLAVVLVAFSLGIFFLVEYSLDASLNLQISATLNKLASVVEQEKDGLEWDPHDRALLAGDDMLPWTIHDESGHLVDALDRLRDGDPLRRPLAAGEPSAGWIGEKLAGEGRYGLRFTRVSESSAVKSRDGKRRFASLTFTVAGSKSYSGQVLAALAATLAVLSLAIWLLAFLAGRRFCRRALRPVTLMAEQAREMRTDEPGERLIVPATRDELEALGRSFNGLLDRLHEALERQRRFTGDASHQLRTPLTALLGRVEVALRHPRSEEEYREVLADAQTQGRHLMQLVEQLLYLSRADAEGAVEKTEAIDLTEWLPGYLRNWSEHPRAEDLRLQAADCPCVVAAHPALLAQLLNNLIDNALKYSRPGSAVTVDVWAVSESVELSVEDRGTGISPEEMPRLFEPFFRSSAARAGGVAGTGLGLSIARRIARLFGGDLSAESEPGRGSRFVLKLPRSC